MKFRHIVRLACALLAAHAPLAHGLDPSRAISQYAHSMWTLQEGFLPGAPTEMAQTTDGYVWIGTRTGLVRFDGVRFVPFVAPPDQPLRSSRILSLRGASDGSLWIGTRAGLHRWRDGRLTHYPDADGWIISIVEDRHGKIWFTRSNDRGKKGPICEVQGDKAVCHGAADGIPIANGRQLSIDASGHLWTVSDETLMRWDGREARTWLPPGLKVTDGKPEALDVWQSVVAAADGSLWIGATQPSRGLGLLRLVDDRIQPFVAPGLDGREVSVSLVFIDRQQTVWVGTQKEGLIRIRGNEVTRFQARDGLSGDTVQNIFEDREGTLWVLTTRGIDAFRDLRVASITSREGLSADLANAVLARRDGTVWVNTWTSLDVLRDGKVTSLNSGNGLPGQQVFGTYEDSKGTLWVGVDNHLHVFEGGRFTTIKAPNGNPLGFVRAMVEDAAGDLWAAVNDVGLWRIRERKVVEHVPLSVVPFRGRSFVADPRGGIWFTLRGGDVGHFRDGVLDSISFGRPQGSAPIDVVLPLPDGALLATTAKGLVGRRGDKVQTMTQAANGLPCEDIYAALVDQRGALWLYASCGVITIAAEQLAAWWRDPAVRVDARVFDALDGAQPAVSNMWPRASMGPDGRLWFANASIVQMIDPQRLGGNAVAPPVHIEQVLADRVAYSPADGLQLQPKTRDLQIHYTGLSLAVPRKTLFRYRLVGHDSEWQEAGTRRQAFYTDLQPGHYEFQVMASNNDGVWSERSASIAFEIPPAFHQTRWFYALCLLAVATILGLVYRVRMRQVAARVRDRLESRLAERERIARDLHDTLLQSVQGLILKVHAAVHQLPEKDRTRERLEHALSDAQQVLIEGRDRVSSLRLGGDGDMTHEIERLGSELAQDRDIEFRCVVQGDRRALHPIVKEEGFLIVREALLNAFRHSGASHISASVQFDGAALNVRVVDDGRGIAPEVLAAGGREDHWGMAGMRERAARMQSVLKIENREGGGTQVELRVPASVAYARA